MKSKVSALAASAVLATGLTAGTANAADPTDYFDPNVAVPFNTAACSNDNYTVPVQFIIHPSLTDLDRLQKDGELITPQDLQEHVDAAWEKTVASYSSSDFSENMPQSLQDAFYQNVTEMMENIEKDTGLSVVISGAGVGMPTPGCN
jgi:hypothetical protein